MADIKDLTAEEMAWIKAQGYLPDTYLYRAVAQIERLQSRVEDLELVVSSANNSLYGSEGAFLNLNGSDTPDKFHLSKPIEDLKRDGRELFRLQSRVCGTCETCKYDQGTFEAINQDYGRYCEVIPSGYVPLRVNGQPFGCTAHEPKEGE